MKSAFTVTTKQCHTSSWYWYKYISIPGSGSGTNITTIPNAIYTPGRRIYLLIALSLRAVCLLFLVIGNLQVVFAGVPSEPLFFEDQLVDHLLSVDLDNILLLQDDTNQQSRSRPTWRQRYYASDKYFKGPGHPIFVIMGGEGEILPSTGLYYPFVVNHLAKDFGAMVIQPEHRFYGKSKPLGLDFTPQNANITTRLMNSEQAMWDYIRLIQYTQTTRGCSLDRHNSQYCPVITVGGSYPGFLSAMMRLMHPNVVDMAYSASAPIKFYAQQVHDTAYYDHITHVAEKSSTGCKAAVRSVLVHDIAFLIQNIQTIGDLHHFAHNIGICANTIPSYIIHQEIAHRSSDFNIDHVRKTLYQELVMVVGYTFANYNMANYPPDNTTALYHACQTFQNDKDSPSERLSKFLAKVDLGDNFVDGRQEEEEVANTTNVNANANANANANTLKRKPSSCFNMTNQLPNGVHATITSGDWSGVGTHRNGQMWDFQTCDLCVEHIGFGKNSMFPMRDWTLVWLNEHCRERFGVSPRPYKFVHEWHIDDLLNKTNTSRILFTNGLNDGWSVGGILESLSDTLPVINFENGAHHSDLSGVGPSGRDTPDIKNGFIKIKDILQEWIMEVKSLTTSQGLRKGVITSIER